jgi:single-strand DNA-binding protein
MASFSSVVLLGYLSRDPELRYTGQGKAVCDLGVAVNRRFTKQGGEQVEEVAFVDVTVWERQGETCAEYLKKGRAVLVSGHLVQDRWVDESSGQKRSKLKVVAERVQFLAGGSKDDEATPPEEIPAEEISPAPAPAPMPPKGTYGSKAAKPQRR